MSKPPKDPGRKEPRGGRAGRAPKGNAEKHPKDKHPVGGYGLSGRKRGPGRKSKPPGTGKRGKGGGKR